MNPENLYLKSPIFFQSLFINLQGEKIKRNRFNSKFQNYLNYYGESDPFKVDEKQLLLFLNEAKKTYFWKNRFNEYKVELNCNENLYEQLNKLPILTKDEVKINLENIINIRIKERISYNHTSGTTGSGLIFPQTESMEQKQWAVWWRYRLWHGIRRDTWMGWFGGRSIVNIKQSEPPFWRINYPMKQVMFSAHHLNERTVQSYFDAIKERKLKWLHGYPSQLSLLANLIKSQKLGVVPVEIITVGAENLLLQQKESIEEVFSCKVKQHYGLAEGVANISEHPNGNLFPDLDFCLTEFIPIDPLIPNICKIIGTNYNNPAFPLIRYDTGDIAQVEWLDGKIPQIISIDGRQEDFITLPNHVKLGRLDHVFKNLVDIREAQIYQSDINNITIRVVKGLNYDITNQESLLICEIRKRVGSQIKISIEYCDRIPRTNSGKLRFVISEVK